jgi:GNAT superfamily N-acetyltransferase
VTELFFRAMPSDPIVPVLVTTSDLALAADFRCGEGLHQQELARWIKEDAAPAMKSKTRVWFYVTNDEQKNIAAYSSLGTSNWRLSPDADKIKVQIIPALAVHEDHQGKGYAQFVLQHLIGEATQRFEISPLLALFVHPDNAVAIHVYEKVGFRCTEHVRYLDVDTAYLGMIREL